MSSFSHDLEVDLLYKVVVKARNLRAAQKSHATEFKNIVLANLVMDSQNQLDAALEKLDKFYY